MDQLGGREAVVELHQIKVLGRHTGLFVCLTSGISGERVDVGQHLAPLVPWIGSQHRRRMRTARRRWSSVNVRSRSPDTMTAAAPPSQFAEHIGRVFGYAIMTSFMMSERDILLVYEASGLSVE